MHEYSYLPKPADGAGSMAMALPLPLFADAPHAGNVPGPRCAIEVAPFAGSFCARTLRVRSDHFRRIVPVSSLTARQTDEDRHGSAPA
jgi:hypothetical protein